MSNIYDFGQYQWVYYRDHGSFLENKEKLGIIIGPYKNEDNEMPQYIYASRGYGITRRTVRLLRISKFHSKTQKRKWRIFDDIIQKKLGVSVVNYAKLDAPDHITYSDGVGTYSVKFSGDNYYAMPDGTDVFEKPTTDKCIHAELNLHQGEIFMECESF